MINKDNWIIAHNMTGYCGGKREKNAQHCFAFHCGTTMVVGSIGNLYFFCYKKKDFLEIQVFLMQRVCYVHLNIYLQ